MGGVSWYTLVVHILLSAKRRAYSCKSIVIEMGGVSRYFSKSIGVRGRFDSPEKRGSQKSGSVWEPWINSGRCPSTVRAVFPMFVFQLSKQQNRTQTTLSTVLGTPPNRTGTKRFPQKSFEAVALWVGFSSGNPPKIGTFTAGNRTQNRIRTPPESEGPKGGRRKGGRGRKLSHFSFCCAFRCCVVYSPCFPVWGEEKVMTIYDAGPLAAGPLCGLLTELIRESGHLRRWCAHVHACVWGGRHLIIPLP